LAKFNNYKEKWTQYCKAKSFVIQILYFVFKFTSHIGLGLIMDSPTVSTLHLSCPWNETSREWNVHVTKRLGNEKSIKPLSIPVLIS